MRLALKPELAAPTLEDIWLLYTASDTFNASAYMKKGYTLLDCFLISGGGAGGIGAGSTSTTKPGGGGGGGGGGSGLTKFNLLLMSLSGVNSIVVGQGARAGAARGGSTSFAGYTIYGGDSGGAGSGVNGGGGAGGGGGAKAYHVNVVESGKSDGAGFLGTASPGGAGGTGGRGDEVPPSLPTSGADGDIDPGTGWETYVGYTAFGGGGGGGGGHGVTAPTAIDRSASAPSGAGFGSPIGVQEQGQGDTTHGFGGGGGAGGGGIDFTYGGATAYPLGEYGRGGKGGQGFSDLVSANGNPEPGQNGAVLIRVHV